MALKIISLSYESSLYKAGLYPQDVIISIDQFQSLSLSDLDKVAAIQSDKQVSVIYVRHGRINQTLAQGGDLGGTFETHPDEAVNLYWSSKPAKNYILGRLLCNIAFVASVILFLVSAVLVFKNIAFISLLVSALSLMLFSQLAKAVIDIADNSTNTNEILVSYINQKLK